MQVGGGAALTFAPACIQGSSMSVFGLVWFICSARVKPFLFCKSADVCKRVHERERTLQMTPCTRLQGNKGPDIFSMQGARSWMQRVCVSVRVRERTQGSFFVLFFGCFKYC